MKPRTPNGSPLCNTAGGCFRWSTREDAIGMSEVRNTIVRLLSAMGSAREIQQYLKRFSQLDAKRFAVVKVGGAVLRDDLTELASSQMYRQRGGLTPIGVHGAGPQLDEKLVKAGIKKRT